MKTLLIILTLALGACSARVAETPSVCDDASNERACHQCVDHAPRGEAGFAVCQSAVLGAAGDECCATTQADGSCVATYLENGHDFTAACAPVQ